MLRTFCGTAILAVMHGRDARATSMPYFSGFTAFYEGVRIDEAVELGKPHFRHSGLDPESTYFKYPFIPAPVPDPDP